ncbi:MAG TPA: hypothetical protein VMY77_00395 [Chitinophagaceae bacterium]|nr:hypothetical protein [Chitinophagaceae bacterium]
MNSSRKITRALFIVPLALAGFALFIWVVMLLWNGVLTEATGVRTITFWQAAGIFALSKILFGFNMGPGGRKRKISHMTPEEKEQFKAKVKERYSWWGRKDEPPTSLAE